MHGGTQQSVLIIDDSEDISTAPPARFDVNAVPADTDLEAMLVAGELDAAMYPAVLSSAMRDGSGVDRLFEDSLDAEVSYYRETGIFPIMHTVVIRDELLETYPWLAVNVQQAFTQARDWCLAKLEDPRWTALAWARQHLEHQQAVLGPNPWPYGFGEENQRTLEKLQEYAEDIGLIPRPYEPEELFVPATLDPDIEGKEYVSLGS
jgi:4,5-dihydroxyphthalate decarboxylase